MLGINNSLIASLVVLCLFSSALYHEKYRFQLHYTSSSPPSGCMNDPNGLVYYDDLFHLFFQQNPREPTAVSRNMKKKKGD